MVERRSPKPEVAGSIPVAPAIKIVSSMGILRSIFKFYQQVKQEVGKVTWPVKNELVSSSLIVISVVVVFSLVCLGIDFFINTIIQMLLNIGK